MERVTSSKPNFPANLARLNRERRLVTKLDDVAEAFRPSLELERAFRELLKLRPTPPCEIWPKVGTWM